MIPATLGWLIFVPAFVAVGLAGVELLLRGLFSRTFPMVGWWFVGFAGTVVNAVISLRLWAAFAPADVSFQFIEYAPWMPNFGANYLVGVDGVALVIAVLISWVCPLVWIACRREICESGKFQAFFLLALETAWLGALCSLNLVLFYVFWELSILPIAFLLASGGRAAPKEAVLPFAGVALAGSLPMLGAIIVLSSLGADPLLEEGRHALDFIAPVGAAGQGLRELAVPLWGEAVWWKTQPVLFAAFGLALASRMGLFPSHAWLSEASSRAPRSAAILLVAIAPLLGAFGFFRFALPLFPDTVLAWSYPLVLLCTVGLLYGGIVAFAEDNARRVIAFACFASLHLAAIGLFSFTGGGLEGTALFLCAYGLAAAGLSLIASHLQRETSEPAHSIPLYGGVAVLLAAVFVGAGLPGSSLFVSKFLVLLASYPIYPKTSLAATFGLALITVVLMRFGWRAAFRAPGVSGLHFGWAERVLLAGVLLPSLWIGFHPEPVLRRVHPSILELCAVIEDKARRDLLREHDWKGCH